MELRHLRYFQAVAEEVNFTRAARRLGVAQPALSRAIQQVEATLGTPVLERTRHRVRLTPAGSVLLQEAARVLERWEEALLRVRRTAAGEEGELRLGYIGPPTQPFLGRVLEEYRRRFPRVAVHLEERTPERVWEMVRQHRVTIGITRPVATAAALGLRTEVLREEPLGVIVPHNHPFARRAWLAWPALTDQPLIVLSRREGLSLHDAILLGCRQAGFAPRITHTPSLIGTVLTYVEAGAGLGIATDSILSPEAPLRFIPLRPARRVPLVLLWHEDDQPPAAGQFRELLLAWSAAGLLWPHANARPATRPARPAAGRRAAS